MQLLYLSCCLVSISAVPLVEEGKWRAAVYEHVLVTASDVGCTETVCTRDQAIELMEANLAVLRENVEEAARQGADLSHSLKVFRSLLTGQTSVPFTLLRIVQNTCPSIML
jgi:hypothetical protein